MLNVALCISTGKMLFSTMTYYKNNARKIFDIIWCVILYPQHYSNLASNGYYLLLLWYGNYSLMENRSNGSTKVFFLSKPANSYSKDIKELPDKWQIIVNIWWIKCNCIFIFFFKRKLFTTLPKIIYTIQNICYIEICSSF